MQNVARARQLAATRAARRLSTVSKFHKMSAGGKPDGACRASSTAARARNTSFCTQPAPHSEMCRLTPTSYPGR
eukprot:6501714-Prymnesium_polylepis.2